MKIKYAFCFALIMYFMILPLSASEYATDELKKYIPDDLMELIPSDVFSDDIEKSASAVSEISGLSFVFKHVLQSISDSFPETLALFSGVMGIIIFGAAIRLLIGEKKRAAFDLCSSLCTAAMVFKLQYSLILDSKEYLSELSALMGGMIPVMSAVYASGGSLASASASANGMLVFGAVCEFFCTGVMIPLVKICFSVSMAGTLCRETGLSEIGKFINKSSIFILTFLAAVCAAVMSCQSVIAQGADSAATKIVKFSLGALVPIVGGAMGDTVKTIFAGLSLVKNSLGVFGVVLIFLLTMPVMAKLFISKFLLGASSALASLIGAKKEEKFLVDVSGVQNMLIAVCAVSFLMFTAAFGIFIKSTFGAGV